MLRYEVKKVFSKTGGKIALLILAAALVLVSYLTIGSVEYVDEQGNSRSGIAAARCLREAKNQWAGEITEDVLIEVLKKNREINASKEYLSKDYRENDKAYAKKQGFSDIRDMMNHAFTDFREYDYYRVDSVTDEEAGSFYERRIASLKEWLYSDEAKDHYSEEEKEFLLKQYQELETPFYYEYSDGWEAFSEYAPTVIMLIVLILGFPVSGIFANEFQLKADAVFFSAKLGRSKAVLSKIGAGLLIITGIYWTIVLLYSAVVFAVLGADGADCVIQTGFGGWKSFYHITFFQEYLLIILGGYLGSLFILTLVMFLSAKTHSAVLAVTVPFILLFIPSFLDGISVLSEMLGLLPDQLLQMGMAVKYFNLYQIGGKVTGAVPLVMTLYPVLFLAMLPVLYRMYRKTQIK